jgi:hypothetical protein
MIFVTVSKSYADPLADLSKSIIPFDLNQVKSSTGFIQKQKIFQETQESREDWNQSLEALPQEVIKSAQSIQEFLFGQSLFKLTSVDSSTCISCLSAHKEVMRLYIGVDFANRILSNKRYSNPQVVIDFIVAHELSHFIYDQLVVLSPEHHTPYGGIKFGDARLPESISRLAGDDDDSRSFLWRIWRAQEHSEVDAYAFGILYSKGLRDYSDILIFLQEEADSTKAAWLRKKSQTSDSSAIGPFESPFIDWQLRLLSLKTFLQQLTH